MPAESIAAHVAWMSRIDLAPGSARSSTGVGQDLFDPVSLLLIRRGTSSIDGRTTA